MPADIGRTPTPDLQRPAPVVRGSLGPVAFVVPDLRGGGAERTVGLITAALDRTARVAPEVWPIRQEGPLHDEIAVPMCAISDRRGAFVERALQWAAGDFGTAITGRRLRALVERRRPAVLVSTLWEADLVVSHARRGMREPVPWITRVVTEAREMYAKILPAAMRERLPGRVLRRATLVVAEARETAERAVAAFGLDHARVRVIPTGLDVERATSLASKLPRAPVDDRTVVAVARLERSKGLDVLIRAFAAVRGAAPGLRLVIVGDGSQARALRALARKSGLEEAVTFVGFDPNPFAYFARCAMAVVPSRYEPFGIVALEAMACGTPVVASDVSGPREVLDGGAAGVLVPPDDPGALAEAVGALLADEGRRRVLAGAGRQRVESLYTLDRAGALWADAIEDARRLQAAPR